MTYPATGQLDYSANAAILRPRNRRGGAAGWGVFFGMPFVWAIPLVIFSALVGLLTGTWFFAPLATFMLICAANIAVKETRRQNGRIIVSYVETAARLNLPLLPFLTAAELSETGRRARQLGRLRELLLAGLPVGAALMDLPDVPEETAARIAAGESMGQLRQAAARTVELDRQADLEKTENPDNSVYRFYPLFLILFSSVMVTGIMIFVVPKFREIFKDFRTTLPASTEFLMAISTFMVEDTPLAILILLALTGAVILMASTYMTNIFLPRFPLPAFSRMVQWVAWRFPGARAIQRNHGMAETCELLSSAITQGMTLPGALQRAQTLDVNAGFRRQLVDFRGNLERGLPPAEAASAAELPPLLVGLLATPSMNNESQAAMFQFLARHYRQRFSRAVLFIRSAFGPIMVMILGFMIGFILLALFSPLVKLIQSVSGGPLL